MNDLVLPGPNLMNRLDDVLLRFREGRLAVTCDIEAMYHMTYVYEQDRNMLRFLWSNGLNDSPEVYRMKVNIFGGVWSGAAAIFCLQECGKEAESESVRKSIMNSFYVDDWLQSADSEEEVQELVSGVRSCLKGGGFRLCKMTGSVEIVNCIPDKKETGPKDRSLGVVGDSVTDCFVVKCPEIGQSRLDTKRSLLRYIALFYDPLGFISPIILQGRLLFQESVKMSVGWDDLLSDDMVSRCESWAESLKPFDVKYRRGTVKRYGVIFTCLTSRCIHIEKLDSLSTESLLMAMDRFMSRRGRPQKIVSDNGGNFVRANMVIAEEINAWNQRQVEEFLLQKGVAWKFNPPYASHFGGIWERHIRTIRKLLFHLLSSQSITDEVLCTVFCQVEWIINYRPITRVNDDAEVLRPIDLLIPLRPNSGPISVVGDQKSTEVVWRQAKNLVEQFWRKWIKLYVQYLQERSKWLKKETNVRVGDIVLVCDLNVRRREWPLGKVSRVIFGRDNLVRSVEILVCGKQILRPISKIVHLEM